MYVMVSMVIFFFAKNTNLVSLDFVLHVLMCIISITCSQIPWEEVIIMNVSVVQTHIVIKIQSFCTIGLLRIRLYGVILEANRYQMSRFL